jgi:hypothetical protein
VQIKEIAEELMQLRKGWGVQADVTVKVGIRLQQLAGIASTDGPDVWRDKLVALLAEAAAKLPDEIGMVALVGLCVWPKAQRRTLDERLAWLAEQTGISSRTALRRVDEAQQRLAGVLASRSPREEDAWYVEQLSSLMQVTKDHVEVIEKRLIVCQMAGLTELDTSISVPRHPTDDEKAHSLDIELLQGGHLERREQPYESYFRNIIALPQRLAVGEKHEFTLRFRTPPGQLMAPHYVHIPTRRSDSFEVHIRFDPECLPGSIWVLDGAPPVAVYERTPGASCVAPSKFGEVEHSFRMLRQGLSYGFCWLS